MGNSFLIAQIGCIVKLAAPSMKLQCFQAKAAEQVRQWEHSSSPHRLLNLYLRLNWASAQ